MNYQLRAEPNIYYEHWLTADTIANQSTIPITHDQYSSRDETPEESSGTQHNNTSNIIDGQAITRKQMKKLKMSFIIAVTTIIVFLVTLAIISLVLLASRRDCQAQQQLDIVVRVAEQVTSLQGNFSAMKNQINTNSEQLNEYNDLAEQVTSLKGNISVLNNQIDTNSAHQTQALNSITETINNDSAEYIQRIREVERSVNQATNAIERMNNNSAIIKTVYIGIEFSGQPIRVSLRSQDPSTLSTLGLISQLYIIDAAHPATSANNIIAYRPYFNDSHNSNMAVLFFNLEAAFPCLRDAHVTPACTLFSLEEDGFLGGRSLIQAADVGNHFRIFSQNRRINTFGFGFSGCSTFNTSASYYYAIGWGPVVFALVGEMIPLQVRGIGSGIATLVNWTTASLVVGFYLYYAEKVGAHFAWWTFSCFNLAVVIFVLVFVPETKGKSLEEIQQFYKN